MSDARPNRAPRLALPDDIEDRLQAYLAATGDELYDLTCRNGVRREQASCDPDLLQIYAFLKRYAASGSSCELVDLAWILYALGRKEQSQAVFRALEQDDDLAAKEGRSVRPRQRLVPTRTPVFRTRRTGAGDLIASSAPIENTPCPARRTCGRTWGRRATNWISMTKPWFGTRKRWRSLFASCSSRRTAPLRITNGVCDFEIRKTC